MMTTFLNKLIFIFLFFLSSAFAEELIINKDPVFVSTHENRFSFQLGLNPSLTKSSDVSNYTFSYATKKQDYWFDSTFLFTNGVFNKITTNNSAATGLNDSQLIDSKSTLTALGMGIGRESSYTQTLLPFKDLYEFMAANITYNLYKEASSNKTFTGPGMIAKFSLLKKFSDYFSAGAQFTYNLAVVKRAQDIDTESSSARSLTISYLTVGFDISFFL